MNGESPAAGGAFAFVEWMLVARALGFPTVSRRNDDGYLLRFSGLITILTFPGVFRHQVGGAHLPRFFVYSLVTSLLLAAASAQNAEKPRIFITDSQSWETSGNAGGSGGTFAAHSSGGARPQTAEIIKTFGERCPDVIVNNRADKAEYVVLLDHEGGKGLALHDNKVAVFNRDGDSILSHSTRSLGNAVKDACEAITKDWPTRAAKVAAAAPETAKEIASANKISVASVPGNADIEIDGSFVGNTPSIVEVNPGEHSVVIKKSGYKSWERKLKVTSGVVNLSAELEKAE
jgi:hypothetical protein